LKLTPVRFFSFREEEQTRLGSLRTVLCCAASARESFKRTDAGPREHA
jgi:hypothetical protein